MNAWLDRARAESIVATARRLGLTIGRDGKSFGPCPCCHRATRASEQSQKEGRREARGACAISGRNRWKCYTNGSDGCGAEGDVVSLACWHLTGRGKWSAGDRETSSRLQAFFANGDSAPDAQPFPAAPVDTVAPRRPPTDELHKLLYVISRPVVEDAEVAAFLKDRALDPAYLARHYLVRALPKNAYVPRWARIGGAYWSRSGHRLLVPMWAPDPNRPGRLRLASVRGRQVDLTAKGEKAASPAGLDVRGLVFASGPEALLDGEARSFATYAEGEMDTMSLLHEPQELRGAVLGVIPGSASEENVAMIPQGWTAVVATHADKGGNAMAMRWLIMLEKAGIKRRRFDLASLARRN